MRELAPRLWRERAGVTTIEFAIVAPVLLALICGAIDMGYVYMAQTALEGSLNTAARWNSAAQTTTTEDREANVRAIVAEQMRSFAPVAGQSVSVTLATHRRFAQATPEEFTDINANGKYDPPASNFVGDPFVDRNKNGSWDAAVVHSTSAGGTGDVVRYTAVFPVRYPFGLFTTEAGLSLTASAVMRNEPVKTE